MRFAFDRNLKAGLLGLHTDEPVRLDALNLCFVGGRGSLEKVVTRVGPWRRWSLELRPDEPGLGEGSH